MTFAEKLKQLREAAGQSREQLSQSSSLSRGVIRDYEQGKRKPTLESAVKLARALGVSVESFAECVPEAESAAEPRRKAANPATVKKPRRRNEK